MRHLQSRAYKPTTVKAYLTDVVGYLKYVSVVAPPSVRIGSKDLERLLLELRARIKEIGREVANQQLLVRRQKSG